MSPHTHRTLRNGWGFFSFLVTLLLCCSGFANEGKRIHFGLTQIPNVTVGDWRVSVTLTTSTDASQDTPRSKELARMRELDEREAQRLGERAPNPLVDLIQQRRDRALGTGFQVANMAHTELQRHSQQYSMATALTAPLGHFAAGPRR